MNVVNISLNFGTFFITYFIYFYLMNKISEKKGFRYWSLFNYTYMLFFPILLFPLSVNLYTYFLYFLSFVLYPIIFYYSTFKRYIVNVFTFYLIGHLSIYLIQFVFTVITNTIYIDITYHVSLLMSILLSASSLLILFIITKLLLIKLLTDDGNEFTNNQFLILLFPSIVGFISLYLFTNYSDDQNNLDISSILLALATVCVVFILVYLANIKTLHAKEKTEASLLREKQFLKENMDIQYSFSYAIAI